MFFSWQKFDDLLIPAKLQDTGLLRGKARIISLVHLILSLASLGFTILNFTILPQKGFQWAIASAMLVFMFYSFKRWGNFIFSGNMISLGCTLALSFDITVNGNLNSDDFHWLMLSPVFAALFTNGRYAIFWYAVYVLIGVYVFNYQVLTPSSVVMPYPPLHYLVSYAVLTAITTSIFFLYKKGEDDTFVLLNKQNESLTLQRQALHQKTTELHKAQEQLTRSNHELASFAYSAGHDLKEPLRMISAYTSLLKKRLKDHLTPDTEEFMGYVTRGSVQMSHLLDDLLEFSKIGRGKDKFAMIDLDDVMYYVKNNLKLVIEESGAVIVQPEDLPKVYARYSEMVQLFQNLISNSLKFRKKDIDPVIEISFITQGDMCQISVKDNGIGIAEEFHAKVFMPFERFHSRSDYEGSGLGMAICSKIIENAGGTIDLKSKENVGTTFFFTLPNLIPDESLESLSLEFQMKEV
jgi:signal transduction histidine kinase